MASLVEMYADESYGGVEGVGPLCLAMYLYERDQACAATKEWTAALNNPDPRSIGFFRMSECAHAEGQFRGLSHDQCDQIARRFIPIPKARSIIGFAATVDQGDFEKIIPKSSGYPNPYTFLAQMCIGLVQAWIKETDYTGKVLYNFEAGHKHRSDTDRIMNEIRDFKTERRSHSYSGHAFVEKEDVPIVQSADLLAWHSFTDFKRRADGKRMRLDYQALGRLQDKTQHWTADQLRRAVPFIEQYEELTKAIEAGISRVGHRRFFDTGFDP